MKKRIFTFLTQTFKRLFGPKSQGVSEYSEVIGIEKLVSLWVDSTVFSKKRRLVEAQMKNIFNNTSDVKKLFRFRKNIYRGTKPERIINKRIIEACFEYIPNADNSTELAKIIHHIIKNEIGFEEKRELIFEIGSKKIEELLESERQEMLALKIEIYADAVIDLIEHKLEKGL